MVDRGYRGPVLIRGRRLDGPARLRFDGGRTPRLELRIPATPSYFTRRRPAFTRLSAPGCYAYQVDGTRFSRLVVFDARPIATTLEDRRAIMTALEGRGLTFEYRGSELLFPVGAAIDSYRIASGYMGFYDFGDPRSAAEAATHVAPDGYSFFFPGRAVIDDWIDQPHWYLSGSVLVVYVGHDASTLSILADVLARQFAGA
jgi:hypothetical protein